MSADQILVRCTDVSRTFGAGANAVVAVHGSSCEVPTGARIAIAGPSGSGKSTLLHVMAGLEIPTRGQVSWPGLSSDFYQRAEQIGIIFQSPSLVPALDVTENVGLPLVLAGSGSGPGFGRSSVRPRLEDALRAVGVADLGLKLPEELSGGQAQRVAVARVLAQRPLLILADEPTGQLDHDSGQRVIDVLLATASRLGAALVVSTHDTAVSRRLTTHWTMHEGRLVTLDQPW